MENSQGAPPSRRIGGKIVDGTEIYCEEFPPKKPGFLRKMLAIGNKKSIEKKIKVRVERDERIDFEEW